MILTRFNSSVLIRASAIISVLIGILYMPSVFNFLIPIIGLGPELTGGQKIAEIWATYALYGGISIFLASMLMNITQSIIIKRIILGIALVATFLLSAAQLLPLFWWFYVGVAVFSWFNVLGFVLHLFLLVLSLWGAFVTIHDLERLKRS
ncbi:hypothetical protein SAMN05444162_0608 [Paenibacillaceae bacterium GAS479]|nr:hypothetical protein SAMN05444162_0608 [Paenibacillaceae bacterium GAS479]